MPILPPALDDRSFDDLVEEALQRIPAHTPEWTNPQLGDPGRTLVELFAWMTDTLLYRANLVPERQRLVFLRLLGDRLRAAVAARGLVTVAVDDDSATTAVSIKPLAAIKGPVPFETRAELTVLPVAAEGYYKRPLTGTQRTALAAAVDGLRQVYHLAGTAVPYVTTPLFPGGAAEPAGFDLIDRTVDKCVWLALLAPKAALRDAVRDTLGRRADGGQQLLNVGVVPAIEVPALFEAIGPRPRIPHVWEISGVNDQGDPEYYTLDVIEDSSVGLTQRGVLRLALPAPELIAAPTNDVRTALQAGVGDRPPRLDVPETAERLVAWLRVRPTVRLQSLSLSWVGINAVEVDQRRTVEGQVVGQSDGSPDQEFQLPAGSVEAETLEIEVEETGLGYRAWQRVDDLAVLGRDTRAFTLDPEAGTIGFGDGVRGMIPEAGRRVRVRRMRVGGGRAGNVPPGTLSDISAQDLTGAPVAAKLKVQQSVATDGGEEAETLDQAEQRIPALFRHRERAVTAEDYRRLAAETPGVRVGRVEVLPRFKPQQRRSDVPGVVSVLVLPYKDGTSAPAPRPDRPFLEAVHRYLDERRPLTSELSVIGCEYVPIGVGAGIAVRDGFGQDEVVLAVREALRAFLWPLAPGGNGTGWDLGRTVRDRELEAAVARVPGVGGVSGINLFRQQTGGWRLISATHATAPATVDLDRWQLPELLAVVVVADGVTPADLRGAPDAFATAETVAVPVVPAVCA